MGICQRISSGFLILIITFLEYTLTEPTADYSNICVNHPPIQTSKTNNESKWTLEEKSKGRTIHFASKNARMRLASALQGMAVDDSKEDYSKMCPYAIIKYLQGHAEADFYGYGSKEVDYMCYVTSGNTGALDCKIIHSNGYTLKYVMYPHYDTRVITTTWCFEDGEVGWMVWSTHDELTPDEEKKALEYLTSIGFDVKDKAPMSVNTCPKMNT